VLVLDKLAVVGGVQREKVDLGIGMMERAWSDCGQATTLSMALL
jgi:hypothetical protein